MLVNGSQSGRPTGTAGSRSAAGDGQTFESINPATEEVLASVAHGQAEDADRAVGAARAAFEDGSSWRTMPHGQRGRILHKLGDLILDHLEELALLESLDNGKPYAVAKAADVPLAADMFHYMSGWTTGPGCHRACSTLSRATATPAPRWRRTRTSTRSRSPAPPWWGRRPQDRLRCGLRRVQTVQNVRSSLVLGFVGAGGIGFQILSTMEEFQYRQASTLLLVLFAVVSPCELGSARVRGSSAELGDHAWPAAKPAMCGPII